MASYPDKAGAAKSAANKIKMGIGMGPKMGKVSATDPVGEMKVKKETNPMTFNADDALKPNKSPGSIH